MLAAKEKTGPWNDAFLPAKTRVWGLPPGNGNGIGGCSPVTSTHVWGCWYVYGETASDGLVNRYYSNAYGRFMTPDPYMASGGPSDPQSWNRYVYTRGDPVDRNDPSGRLDCSADPDDAQCTSAGACDPSDATSSCNFCYGSDGFTQSPNPLCQSQGPPFASLPETSPSQDSCDLRLFVEIDSLLTSKNSPLAGYSAWFVAVGLMDDIDPRLLVTIAGAESSFGKSPVATKDKNAFGILHKVGQSFVPVVYPSFGPNISAAGNTVEFQVYNRGNNTVNLLYSGQSE